MEFIVSVIGLFVIIGICCALNSMGGNKKETITLSNGDKLTIERK